MNFSKFILSLGVIGFIIVFLGMSGIGNTKNVSGKYDDFAKCLNDNGVKMYSAYWCSHCARQKELFEGSWKYIHHIECSLPNKEGQTKICHEAGIRAYPTWEFKDGKRIEGEVTFMQLSLYGQCPFNE